MSIERLVTEMSVWTTEEWLRFAEVAAVLTAALVAWRQLALLRRQLRDDHLKACRDRALEYSLVRSPQLREMRDVVDQLFSPDQGAPVAWEQIQQALQQNPHLRICLIALFAHWENLALTIAARVCDEDLAFEMAAGTLLEYVDRFAAFVRQRRVQNPRRYRYLLLLADRWRMRLKRRGRKNHFAFGGRC